MRPPIAPANAHRVTAAKQTPLPMPLASKAASAPSSSPPLHSTALPPLALQEALRPTRLVLQVAVGALPQEVRRATVPVLPLVPVLQVPARPAPAARAGLTLSSLVPRRRVSLVS